MIKRKENPLLIHPLLPNLKRMYSKHTDLTIKYRSYRMRSIEDRLFFIL